MTISLLHPHPDAPSAPPPDPPGRRHRRRRPLAVLLVASGLLGGGAGAGVLAASGAAGGDATRTTTVIARQAAASSLTAASSASSGIAAKALYARTSPGVVDITVRTTASDSRSPFGNAPQQGEATASGTGFLVDEKGHIVTAAHVVDDATSVSVKLSDGTVRKATVLGHDNATDIAVIRIDPSGMTLHPLALGSSASLDVGDPVAAIGDPFGYARSLSTGIVSGVDRTIQAPNGFTVSHAIQTDAALNPGNSGGPVLDASGKVVGIADQIATDGSSEQGSGVGFAVPVDLVKSALGTLEAGGKVTHAYLGIASADSATAAGGARVSAVTGGGPASRAGLRTGDVVTAFGGRAVTDSTDLVAAIAARRPGDTVTVTLRRGSRMQKLDVKLGTQPARS